MRTTPMEQVWKAATAIGADMRAKCRNAPAGTRVSIPIDEFRRIADLLSELSTGGHGRAGGVDEDGFRFWLPMAQIEAQRVELAELRAQVTHDALRLHADSFRF